MNIVVIGGSGMIGLYLVDDLLKEGHHVVATGSKREAVKYYASRGLELLNVNIENKDDFNKLPQKDVDVVIHLAAIMPATMKGYNPYRYFEVNTIGTLNVLEYCKKVNVKQILYTESHSDVGGYWGKKTINPYERYNIKYGNDHSVYIISKIAGLELIKHYHAAIGISYAVFRCPNIYSYHPDDYYYVDGISREVAYRKIIKKAMKSEEIEIWGECKTKKDIVYVKDLTQMMLKAIEKKISAGIYNVATGTATSLEQQILGIVDVFSPKGNPSKIVYKPEKEIFLNNHHYSIKNVIDDLGYKPQYSYKKMLRDMKKEMEGDRFKYWNE